MAKRETTAVRAAFSISQCVTKRARQLERLQFTLEATVRKIRACTPPSDATFLYSAKTQIQSQRDFALLLLQFLQQEERADTPQLFDTALPLEDCELMMPRLLALQDEEEHVRQRTEIVWQVLRSKASDASVQELITKCEHKWFTLVYGSAYLHPTIAKIQELCERHHAPSDEHSPTSPCRGMHSRSGSIVLASSVCMRPAVAVNHRLSWATPLSGKANDALQTTGAESLRPPSPATAAATR